MTTKTNNIIHWTAAGLIAFIFIGSAMSKLFANEEALAAAAKFGLSPETYSLLGIIELLAVALFVYPRTGLLGTLLLVAYMGGAVAIHVAFQQPIAPPAIVAALVWIAATIRFPELSKRILNQ